MPAIVADVPVPTAAAPDVMVTDGAVQVPAGFHEGHPVRGGPGAASVLTLPLLVRIYLAAGADTTRPRWYHRTGCGGFVDTARGAADGSVEGRTRDRLRLDASRTGSAGGSRTREGAMGLKQVTVVEIVRQAVGKSVDIPEFQRDFVWDAEQVKKLAESLFRRYPVGSFLLWDSTAYGEAKTAQGTQASLWIVDGQQRTTALALLLGMKPFWWPDHESWNAALDRSDVMVNVLPDGDGNQLEFALPNPVRRKDPRWTTARSVLSVERVEDLTRLARELAGRIAGDGDHMAVFPEVHGRLQRLWQVRETTIPVVEIAHEVEDVAEIFARLNQAGTRVTEADVVLALAAARNPGWVRTEYIPFRNELEERGWDLDAGIFVRATTAMGHGRARLIEVPRSFWSPDSLPAAWRACKRTIAEVVRRLGEYGLLSPEILPSANSLIPLFALHGRWAADPAYRFGQAFRWFLLANRDGRYSGSAVTSLNEDVRAIAESKSFSEAIAALEGRLRVNDAVAAEEFLGRYDRANNRFLRLMVYLALFRGGARDWVDKTRIAYDKTGIPVTGGFEPQWHHIFPRKVLADAAAKADDINALANITVINERTNVKKLAAKEPWRSIVEYSIAPEDLRAHFVSPSFAEAATDSQALRHRWSTERFGDFISERAGTLAMAATALLQDLRNDGPRAASP